MKFFSNYVSLEFTSVTLFLKNYLNFKDNTAEVSKNSTEARVNLNRCHNKDLYFEIFFNTM